jgi:hypothetical protein
MSTFMLRRPCCCTCTPYTAQATGSVVVDLSGLTAAQTTNCVSPPTNQSLTRYGLAWVANQCVLTTGTNINQGVGNRVFDNITVAWNSDSCRWELGIYGQNGGGQWVNQNGTWVWVPNPHPLEVIWFGIRQGPKDAQGHTVPNQPRGTYTQTAGCATGPAAMTVGN